MRLICPFPLISATLALATMLPLSASESAYAAIKPIVDEFCLTCHSTKKQKGDFDLEIHASAEGLRRHPKVWQHVLGQMNDGEMPPKDKPQPTPAQREKLLAWIRTSLDAVARERAGDPGPVVLRRLSNAEYTYTIRDLTGIATLDPAKEFPVDGAAGEGFTNTGMSLVMSPALVTKFLDAGKDIARHALLVPDGVRWSTGTSRRDGTDELLNEIRAFYARYAVAGEAGTVSLQGIPLDRSHGSKLPLDRYLAAALDLRDGGNLDAVATTQHLSAKYLRSVVDYLSAKSDTDLGLRGRWQNATAKDLPALVAEIDRWQKVLWKFHPVGKVGWPKGPARWMEAVSPLTARHEAKLKLADKNDGSDQLISLVAEDAGGGMKPGIVIWQDPKLILAGRPPVLLKDVATIVDSNQRFGTHPTDAIIADSDLAVRAPAVITLRIPGALAAKAELVANVTMSGGSDANAIRARIVTGAPSPTQVDWWSGDPATPLLTQPEGTAYRRISTVIADLQRLFPASVCYTRIVPVDEVVTLTLFFREDLELKRLALSDAEVEELDRLWQQLHFISQQALIQVDAFEQLWQYATQDGDPKSLEPMRQPIAERAEEFRRFQVACEPKQLDAIIAFADRAYRRPLTDGERSGLQALYRTLRRQEIPHDEALRLVLARVLVSPGFLYKAERPAPGKDQRAISGSELATRLSYFLWSSQPDQELRSLAESGRLSDAAVLTAQVRRMLADKRAERLALEFGLAWLHLHGVDTLDEKSERHFPTFLTLRGDLHEESVRFLADLLQHDRSLLSVIDADHTFLNENLAKHYGIPGVTGSEWRRVDGVRKYHRGGVLGLGAGLAKHAGASRTSPILRGNWIAEVLLGDKLPRPPKGVPQLPEDDNAARMTMREITERHTADPKCASCHARIDPYGYTMESFDPIGRWRDSDVPDKRLDTKVKVPDGSEIDGVEGLRAYLLGKRRDAFVQQFCRKLLGFALGRGTQLSDEPLLAEIQAKLAANQYRVSIAIESIVQSRQFREIRGRDAVVEE
jgi:Protein of unknown function (DUF1592)/Protein of unknown function (DUF1588)/Protein of unknown function (DUF1585)/Protein of unknown function (DUF1587)/Protein of unknown function (DUF1595)/Planctomycete cytochrome C